MNSFKHHPLKQGRLLSEDYKCEDKNCECAERTGFTKPLQHSSMTIADQRYVTATSITHMNLWTELNQLSCILGIVGSKEENAGTQEDSIELLLHQLYISCLMFWTLFRTLFSCTNVVSKLTSCG